MGVVSSKLTTKAYGELQGGSSVESDPKNLSALDLKKLGGEDVGAVLNKVADPNWVDPSKKPRATGNNSLDRDAFFKLMLTQMKNQDPTNPLKSHEMAAQLASFSSLEQMQNINTTLQEMKAGQKPVENYQALNLIGKAVSGDSAKLIRNEGDKAHDFEFDLSQDASEIQIKIRNSQGEIVRDLKFTDLKKGANSISWNGEDERGQPVPKGEYQYFVEAKDMRGAKVGVKTDFEGVITGINYSAQGPVLMIGNHSIHMRDVKKIIDPSLMKNDQISPVNEKPDLKKEAVGAQTMKVPPAAPEVSALAGAGPRGTATAGVAPEKATVEAPAVAQVRQNVFDEVGLSRGMMNRLNQEMK